MTSFPSIDPSPEIALLIGLNVVALVGFLLAEGLCARRRRARATAGRPAAPGALEAEAPAAPDLESWIREVDRLEASGDARPRGGRFSPPLGILRRPHVARNAGIRHPPVRGTRFDTPLNGEDASR